MCLCLIIGCCIVTRIKWYWLDEIATVLNVANLSFSEMWSLLQDQFNLNPPVYFVVMWGWAKLFGHSEISFRLFSALCVAGGFWFTFRALLRSAGYWPALLGSGLAFGLAPIVLFHLAEARCYALCLFLGALLLWQYERFTRTEKPGWGALALNAGLHAALVMTHYVCFFYSGIFLVAGLWEDWRGKRLRWGVAGSVIAGWLIFIPWIPTFRWHSQMAQDGFWTSKPALDDLLQIWYAADILIPVVPVVFGALLIMRGLPKDEKRSVPDVLENFGALERLALGLVIFAPLLIYLYSQIRSPIFIARYLVVTSLGWAILFTWGLKHIWGRRATEPERMPGRPLLLATLLALLLLTTPAWYAKRLFAESGFRRASESKKKPGLDVEDLYPDLAIACDDMHSLQRWYYARKNDADPTRYVFICDDDSAFSKDPSAFDKDGHPYSATANHFYSAARRHLPQVPIMNWEEFAAKNPRFLVNPGGALFKVRLSKDPHYKIKYAGPLMLVEPAS